MPDEVRPDTAARYAEIMAAAGNPPKGSPAAFAAILRHQGQELLALQVEQLDAVAKAALAKLKAERDVFRLEDQLAAREGWEERDDEAEAKVRRAFRQADDDLEIALVDLYGDEARDLEFEREIEAILDEPDDEEDED